MPDHNEGPRTFWDLRPTESTRHPQGSAKCSQFNRHFQLDHDRLPNPKRPFERLQSVELHPLPGRGQKMRRFALPGDEMAMVPRRVSGSRDLDLAGEVDGGAVVLGTYAMLVSARCTVPNAPGPR